MQTRFFIRRKLIRAQDIANARKLRAIVKHGTGIDIIDQNACEERKITILITPGVITQSVAELVLSLTMAVERQLRMILIGQGTGLEVRKEHCCGTERNGKSIGIVGIGNIGTAVARIFRGASNASVYACDPWALEGAWSDIPHTRVNNWEEMLPYVDILTLHVSLNSKTSCMFDADTWSRP
jgi:phosphoglycerate dehydrogenase-like enzyme